MRRCHDPLTLDAGELSNQSPRALPTSSCTAMLWYAMPGCVCHWWGTHSDHNLLVFVLVLVFFTAAILVGSPFIHDVMPPGRSKAHG